LADVSALSLPQIDGTEEPRRPTAPSTVSAADVPAPGTARSHTDGVNSVHSAPAGATITAKERVQTQFAFVKDERCRGSSHGTGTLPCWNFLFTNACPQRGCRSFQGTSREAVSYSSLSIFL